MKIKEDHKYHRINKMQKQENNILPEYQTLPPDSIAPEYPSLPDEYLQSKQPVEKGVTELSESRKRKVMRILCMRAACVLLGCGVYGTEADQTKIPAQTTEEIQAPDENGENRDSRENDHVQSVTTETETDVAIAETSEPVDGQYPLEGGILYYKIYNETHLANPTADAWERILEEGEITIEQLLAGEVIALPQPETPEGFAFLGWAAHFQVRRIPIRSGVCLRKALPQRMQPGSNRMRKAIAVWIFTRCGTRRILLHGR